MVASLLLPRSAVARERSADCLDAGPRRRTPSGATNDPNRRRSRGRGGWSTVSCSQRREPCHLSSRWSMSPRADARPRPCQDFTPGKRRGTKVSITPDHDHMHHPFIWLTTDKADLGGQASLGANATLLSSHVGGPSGGGGRHKVCRSGQGVETAVESQPAASPRDLPIGSDVTAQAPKTMTVTGVSSITWVALLQFVELKSLVKRERGDRVSWQSTR